MSDPIGFAGQFGAYTEATYTDKTPHQSGLVWMTHRGYNPRTGRFLSRDPIGYEGGINLYAYAGNNPVTHADPSGLLEIGGFDFTLDGIMEGLKTGLAVTGDTLSFGLYSSKAYKDKPGYDGSNVLSQIGRESAITAATLGLGEAYDTWRIEKQLQQAATRARAITTPGRNATTTGTRIHSSFEREVNALGNKRIQTEISYQNGQQVVRGTRGSIRLDVQVKRRFGRGVKRIYDLKTGRQGLTTSRIQQIRGHLPRSLRRVPIKEIRS